MRFDTSSQNSSEAARWRHIRRQVIQRTVAVATGIALWLLIAFLPEFVAEKEWLWFAVQIISYSMAGLILGFIWPAGWRLGLYLMAVWPPFIVAWFILTDPPTVINWREVITFAIRYLLELLLILAGAMGGAWAGSQIRRRMSGDTAVRGNAALP